MTRTNCQRISSNVSWSTNLPAAIAVSLHLVVWDTSRQAHRYKVISALINSSGSAGLSSFLPEKSSSPPVASNAPPHLPLSLSSVLTFPYPANPRAFALRLIQRYSYVLGATPNRFFGATSAYETSQRLRIIDVQDTDIALLCVNDDLSTTDSRSIANLDNALQTWMKGRWPDRAPYELEESDMPMVIDHRQVEPCV